MNAPPLIECVGVERRYGRGRAETAALRGIDLTVRAGEILAVVGPSGCGKSTLLHLLGAMDRPDGGSVRFDGRDLARLDDAEASRLRREEIGFVFQFFNLLPTLDVVDNVALPARFGGESAAAARSRARELLERVGLADKLAAYPDALSGGQQQRVAIARALVARPRLVLADEPTGALDQATGREVLQLLARVVTEEGAALVMATHSDDATEIAGRVLRLEDGTVRSLEERARRDA